jgi:transposase
MQHGATPRVWHDRAPAAASWRQYVLAQLATEAATLPPHSLRLFPQLLEAWAGREARMAPYEAPLAQGAQMPPGCQRLRTSPSLGELTATAFAVVSDATQCNHGRQFAAWLGLVSRPHRTGGKPRLLGSSNHGDSSLRQPVGHGAQVSALGDLGLDGDRAGLAGSGSLRRRAEERAERSVDVQAFCCRMPGEWSEEGTGQTSVPSACCDPGPVRPIHRSGGPAQRSSGCASAAGFPAEAR